MRIVILPLNRPCPSCPEGESFPSNAFFARRNGAGPIKRIRIFRSEVLIAVERENRAATNATGTRTRAFERTTRAFEHDHENAEGERGRESACSRACWCKVVTWAAYKVD